MWVLVAPGRSGLPPREDAGLCMGPEPHQAWTPCGAPKGSLPPGGWAVRLQRWTSQWCPCGLCLPTVWPCEGRPWQPALAAPLPREQGSCSSLSDLTGGFAPMGPQLTAVLASGGFSPGRSQLWGWSWSQQGPGEERRPLLPPASHAGRARWGIVLRAALRPQPRRPLTAAGLRPFSFLCGQHHWPHQRASMGKAIFLLKPEKFRLGAQTFSSLFRNNKSSGSWYQIKAQKLKFPEE